MKEMLRNPGYTALIPLFLHGYWNKDVFSLIETYARLKIWHLLWLGFINITKKQNKKRLEKYASTAPYLYNKTKILYAL